MLTRMRICIQYRINTFNIDGNLYYAIAKNSYNICFEINNKFHLRVRRVIFDIVLLCRPPFLKRDREKDNERRNKGAFRTSIRHYCSIERHIKA